MGILRRLFFGSDLREKLGRTRAVRVHDVRFVIRKIDPLSYLTGSKVMLSHYASYEEKRAAGKQDDVALMKATRDHYRDVFLQAVVEPKLCRTPEEAKNGEIPVDYLMTEWDMAVQLYVAIIEFTYGKKKVLRSDTLLARSS